MPQWIVASGWSAFHTRAYSPWAVPHARESLLANSRVESTLVQDVASLSIDMRELLTWLFAQPPQLLLPYSPEALGVCGVDLGEKSPPTRVGFFLATGQIMAGEQRHLVIVLMTSGIFRDLNTALSTQEEFGWDVRLPQ